MVCYLQLVCACDFLLMTIHLQVLGVPTRRSLFLTADSTIRGIFRSMPQYASVCLSMPSRSSWASDRKVWPRGEEYIHEPERVTVRMDSTANVQTANPL